MNELKPCPFCGGKAKLLNETRLEPPCHYSVYVIECGNCGARTKDYTNDGYYGERYTVDDVVNVWNNRVYKDDETSDYFILPKPKDELFTFSTEVVLNDAGKITLNERIDIIREALDRWKKELNQEMTQRLFETFRPTCKALLWEGEEYLYKCSECGGIITLDDFFCSNCGAKVDW